MNAVIERIPDSKAVLSKALLNAGRLLGLAQSDIGEIVGKDRSSIARGLDPASKSGELALLLIRCYRSLFVLVGGEPADLRHWMHTENRDLAGVPAELMRKAQGLIRVVEYLDAMRGRV